jgi:gliding motility-associated transport system ATP-binding protein
MSTDVMIHADSLTKMFGSLTALDRVSFDVRKGEVVGFLGPNGAGKSTTMRILTCFISPTAGTAKIHGFDVFEQPLEVRQKIGYLPQRAPLYPEMTVWAYLEFCAAMRGIDGTDFKRRLRKSVEVCGIAQVLGKDIRTLSHGYRQRVGLAQALIHDPPILILDEPTSDLDPNEKSEVISYIREIGKERTVLLSTHNLSEVEAACARAIIVSKGRLVADGTLDDIRAKSGRIRYVVSVHEQKALNDRTPPSVEEVQKSLERIKGVALVKESPSDERAHTFALSADGDIDVRPEIFQLMVEKGWLLIELHRDAQTLGDVFRDLTRAESRTARGLRSGEDEEDEDEDEDEDDEEEDDEDDEEEDDEEDKS